MGWPNMKHEVPSGDNSIMRTFKKDKSALQMIHHGSNNKESKRRELKKPVNMGQNKEKEQAKDMIKLMIQASEEQ